MDADDSGRGAARIEDRPPAPKQLTAARAFGTPDRLATSRTADELREAWRLVTPLVDWVMEHVGPA